MGATAWSQLVGCLQAREGVSGASTPRSHVSSPWNTDASEGEDEGGAVLSAAAATRHALQAGTTATLSEGNQAKMREVGATGAGAAGRQLCRGSECKGPRLVAHAGWPCMSTGLTVCDERGAVAQRRLTHAARNGGVPGPGEPKTCRVPSAGCNDTSLHLAPRNHQTARRW